MSGPLFLVVSGIPGSGKTTLAKRLGSALQLPVVDKDDILAELFEERGIGDDSWRKGLSRESDLLFRERALASKGALLVSFWHVAGMPPDSGTPTDWLSFLWGTIVNLRCVCPPEVAARRFQQRQRHPGHLDHKMSLGDLVTSLQKLDSLGPPLGIGPHIELDTFSEPDLDPILRSLASLASQCL